MFGIGGALIENFKPILDEFKRRLVILEVPYGQCKDRYRGGSLDRSRLFTNEVTDSSMTVLVSLILPE
jgi:hypothetical protein